MKRYDLDSFGDDFYMTEAPDGDYVRFEDAAALRAKLLDREEKFVAKHAELVAADARLAAATKLLRRCQDCIGPVIGALLDGSLRRDLDAFLAAQPAAPLPRLSNGHAQWCAEMTMVGRACDCQPATPAPAPENQP